MDNNPNPSQPQAQPQPAVQPGQSAQPQPPVQGQPQPYQGQAQPQPYPPQPAQGQYQQPYQQPYGPQPMPKQPMDPAKKKKIILIVSICSGILVLGIIAAIVIPIILRVDYAPAYKTAKELKPKLYAIYQDYDCDYITRYVNSSYTSAKTYGEYVSGCLETLDSSTDTLVTNLGATAGITRNTEIRAQYDRFVSEYNKISTGSTEDLAKLIAYYEAWHNFKIGADDVNWRTTSDATITAAANYLIESGHDTLKSYGETWLKYALEVAAAYRAYDNATSNYSALYSDYSKKNSEMREWATANQPDMSTLVPLNFADTSKMYSEFTTLYNMIAQTYEDNYNSGSGDCTEFLGDVYCD